MRSKILVQVSTEPLSKADLTFLYLHTVYPVLKQYKNSSIINESEFLTIRDGIVCKLVKSERYYGKNEITRFVHAAIIEYRLTGGSTDAKIE